MIKQNVKSDLTKLNDRNKNFIPLETEFQNKRSKEEIVVHSSPNNYSIKSENITSFSPLKLLKQLVKPEDKLLADAIICLEESDNFEISLSAKGGPLFEIKAKKSDQNQF